MERVRIATWLAICVLPVAAIALAQEADFDGDGVEDHLDNCSDVVNVDQDDSDGDFCGNLCDADYDDDGRVGFPDFGEWMWACTSFPGGGGREEMCHFEPIAGCIPCSFPNFGFVIGSFGSVPGPSGTTPGTVACP